MPKNNIEYTPAQKQKIKLAWCHLWNACDTYSNRAGKLVAQALRIESKERSSCTLAKALLIRAATEATASDSEKRTQVRDLFYMAEGQCIISQVYSHVLHATGTTFFETDKLLHEAVALHNEAHDAYIKANQS